MNFVISLRKHFTGDDMTFIANAPIVSQLSACIEGADDEHKVIVANRSFHILSEVISQYRIPLIDSRIHSIGAQAAREFLHPFVDVLLPGVGDEDGRGLGGG